MGFRKSLFLRPISTFLAVSAASAALALSSAGCVTTAPASGSSGSGGLTMDEALVAAAANMMASIDAGTKVAILNYSSASECLSEYVVRELEANIVETGKVTVVDRKELDLIRSEMDFQYSSEVRNESAQDLGRKLGAQVIITGTHTELAGTHRVLIRALVVESAVVSAQYRNTVVADAVITALVKNCDKSPVVAAPVTQVAQAGGAAPVATAPAAAPAAPAKPATIANGTYTFWPRPRAHFQGRNVNTYLDKIVVRGGFFTMYFVSVPQGQSGNIPEMGHWARFGCEGFIQNLDQPSRPPIQATKADKLWESGSVSTYFTFNNHNITRFSFNTTAGGGDVQITDMIFVFEEIDMSKAEFQAP